MSVCDVCTSKTLTVRSITERDVIEKSQDTEKDRDKQEVVLRPLPAGSVRYGEKKQEGRKHQNIQAPQDQKGSVF